MEHEILKKRDEALLRSLDQHAEWTKKLLDDGLVGKDRESAVSIANMFSMAYESFCFVPAKPPEEEKVWYWEEMVGEDGSVVLKRVECPSEKIVIIEYSNDFCYIQLIDRPLLVKITDQFVVRILRDMRSDKNFRVLPGKYSNKYIDGVSIYVKHSALESVELTPRPGTQSVEVTFDFSTVSRSYSMRRWDSDWGGNATTSVKETN